MEINNIISGKFQIKANFIGMEDKLFFTLYQINDIEILDVQNDQFKLIEHVYGEVETSW